MRSIQINTFGKRLSLTMAHLADIQAADIDWNRYCALRRSMSHHDAVASLRAAGRAKHR